ncbi:hypothetical protein AGMMS49992_13710 [Clostridia bacterium]|nr:hypothetical protein AGMMS49992_13710 [Clostridia bacterium]
MKFLKDRRFRYGGYAIIATILVVAALVVVNIASTAIEDNWALRWDLSYNSITKFSESTKNALAELNQPVTFYVMGTDGGEDAQLMEVLDRFRASNRNITVTTVDPDKNPALVNKFRGTASSLAANTVVVTNADETRFKVFTYYDMVNIGQDTNSGQYYISSYKFEAVLAQGLLYVTSGKTYTAYFLEGHGEVGITELSALTTLLNSNNYDTASLPLGSETPDPSSSIIVIADPQRDIDEASREQLMGYAQAGGGFVFAWAASTPAELPNFQALLDYYNIGFTDTFVSANGADSTQFYTAPYYILSTIGEHDITTPLTSAGRAYIISIQSLAIKDPAMKKNEVEITPLLSSAAGSFLVDQTISRGSSLPDWQRASSETAGPFTLAAAVQRRNFADTSKDSHALAIGSIGSIASSSILNYFSNGEFVMSAFKWVGKDAAVNLSVMSKTAQRGSLRLTSQSEVYLLAGLSILLLPLLTLAAALVVTLRRRHL